MHKGGKPTIETFYTERDWWFLSRWMWTGRRWSNSLRTTNYSECLKQNGKCVALQKDVSKPGKDKLKWEMQFSVNQGKVMHPRAKNDELNSDSTMKERNLAVFSETLFQCISVVKAEILFWKWLRMNTKRDTNSLFYANPRNHHIGNIVHGFSPTLERLLESWKRCRRPKRPRKWYNFCLMIIYNNWVRRGDIRYIKLIHSGRNWKEIDRLPSSYYIGTQAHIKKGKMRHSGQIKK